MKKKTFIKSLFIFLISLLLIVSSIKVTQASIVWEYEENLNDFKPYDCYYCCEGYNSFSLVRTANIDIVSFYSWNNPSNATNTVKIKLGIYTNFNNSPEVLISQTPIIYVTTVGWVNAKLSPKISLTVLTTYWVGWIVANCSEIKWQYYRNVTNPLLFTQYEGDVIWPNLFNPAEPDAELENTRYGVFRLGLETIDTETTVTDFIDIFRNPQNYFGGIMVITMTILLIYFILRRR